MRISVPDPADEQQFEEQPDHADEEQRQRALVGQESVGRGRRGQGERRRGRWRCGPQRRFGDDGGGVGHVRSFLGELCGCRPKPRTRSSRVA